jgi:hypothetical protein
VTASARSATHSASGTLAYAAIALVSMLGWVQIGLWLAVVLRDRTPLVHDSAELYLYALQAMQHGEVDASPRPPLLWLMLGALLSCTGPMQQVTAVWALAMHFVLCSIAAGLALRLGASRSGAGGAAMICAILPGLVGPSRYFIPDQSVAVLQLLVLLALSSPPSWRSLLLAAMGSALAVLSKLTSLFYLMPMWPWAWCAARARPRTTCVVLAIASTLPGYWLWVAGARIQQYYAAQAEYGALDSSVGMPRGSWRYLGYYPMVLAGDSLGPIGAPVIAGGVACAWGCLRLRRWLLLPLAVIVLFTISPARSPRYLIGILPILAAIAAVGYERWLGPAKTLVVAAIVSSSGSFWLASLVVTSPLASGYAPLLLHHPGTLHGEDLAGIGLFAPIDADWGGSRFAAEVLEFAGQRSASEVPLIVIGVRPFVLWDVRLRLLESGFDPPVIQPRELERDERIAQEAELVLFGSFRGRERDILRKSLTPYTAAELARRGYLAEERFAHWFQQECAAARFEAIGTPLSTEDGHQVQLYRRR